MANLGDGTLPIIGVVALLVLLIAFWLLRRRPKERIRATSDDVLTPGAAPAQRNTLLVDAPPVVAPPAAGIIGGVGEIVAAASAEEAVQAQETVAMPDEDADDLTRIKGLGPKIRTLLAGIGITRFAQIADWSEADIARIDAQMGAFQGRIVRDNWVEQARYLAADDIAGFEARFGKV